MTAIGWMVVASVASALAAVALFGAAVGPEILAGMLGPLVAASTSWRFAEHTFKRRPEELTAAMMKAFAGKLVFFGAYVAVAVTALPLRPVPFVVSFTSYFIVLYLIEALLLRRLFAGAPRRP